MRRRHALVALGPASLALFASAALGSPAGDLDRSFDGDGKRILADPYVANEVRVQGDGKILVVGNGGPANDFAVTRLMPDGSIDRGYGKEGTAVADFGENDHAHAAAIQPDGRLVVAGDSNSLTGPKLAVARFDAEGELDQTFDPGGADGDGKKIVSSDPGASQFDAAAVLVQPDGRIVLAGQGYSDTYDMAVTRLTATGEVDGTAWERAGFDAPVNAYAAALAPDGDIVVTGTRFPELAPSEIALARFDTDGKLDETFGGTGEVTFASDAAEETQDVLVQPDGKIVVAGTRNASGYAMVVTRFNGGGTPDTSWDDDARAFADFDGQSYAAAAALQPDGKIIAVGLTTAGIDMAAARFRSDGPLDSTFGSGGRVTVGFDFIEVAHAVALQPDGRVILAGQSAAGAPVVRLQADPPPASGGGGARGDGGGGDVIVDRTAPVVDPLSLANRRFRVARRPRGASRMVPRGTTFRFGLSEAATVTFAIERRAPGRQSRGSCRAVTRRNRRTPRCIRFVPVGSFARTLAAGRQSVSFSGRLNGRALRRARYRVAVEARDAAQNLSSIRTAAFRVVR